MVCNRFCYCRPPSLSLGQDHSAHEAERGAQGPGAGPHDLAGLQRLRRHHLRCPVHLQGEMAWVREEKEKLEGRVAKLKSELQKRQEDYGREK